MIQRQAWRSPFWRPRGPLILAVEMTQPYLCYCDRNSLLHSRCVVHNCHRRHSGYGDTDHPNNDSLLGDEALPLPYLWDCQSSIENFCGKHGGFNVGDCRRHQVGYGGRISKSCQERADVPRPTPKAVGFIPILPIKEDINASYFQGNPS